MTGRSGTARATTRPRGIVAMALLLFAAAGHGSEPPGFALEALAEGVYVHLGRYAELDQAERADSANLGVVIGERCVAVIDSGGAVATGAALLAAIRQRSDKPVCYVINTHVHFDHVLGNAALRGTGAVFVGHRNLADAIEANREFFADNFSAELGAADGALVVGPDRLVGDRVMLDLGGRTLEVRAVSRAHSTTDVTVHDSHTGILWTGDLLFRERMPVLDGSLLGWIAWLEAAMAERYTAVVPGHGPVDREWPAGAQAQHAYFTLLRDETRAAVAAGKFLDEARESVAVSARDLWRLTERAHPLNVSRAYRELEWE